MSHVDANLCPASISSCALSKPRALRDFWILKLMAAGLAVGIAFGDTPMAHAMPPYDFETYPIPPLNTCGPLPTTTWMTTAPFGMQVCFHNTVAGIPAHPDPANMKMAAGTIGTGSQSVGSKALGTLFTAGQALVRWQSAVAPVASSLNAVLGSFEFDLGNSRGQILVEYLWLTSTTYKVTLSFVPNVGPKSPLGTLPDGGQAAFSTDNWYEISYCLDFDGGGNPFVFAFCRTCLPNGVSECTLVSSLAPPLSGAAAAATLRSTVGADVTGPVGTTVAYDNIDAQTKQECYPDCDGNSVLNIDDFICYQTSFSLGDPYADCDASGAINIDDFICFQTFFAIGC